MKSNMNLTDHFLIASPSMQDAFFEGCVIYICEHHEDGAIGVIINKPSPITVDLVFETAGKATPERFRGEWVMVGGPVQVDRGFVIHMPIGSWQNSVAVNDDIAMTTSRDIIEKLSSADVVQHAFVTIGYSSWRKGQLEQELIDNAWLTVKADQDILFGLPHEKRYSAALAKLGITPENLMSAGHA